MSTYIVDRGGGCVGRASCLSVAGAGQVLAGIEKLSELLYFSLYISGLKW